jgi:hypothetical protein
VKEEAPASEEIQIIIQEAAGEHNVESSRGIESSQSEPTANAKDEEFQIQPDREEDEDEEIVSLVIKQEVEKPQPVQELTEVVADSLDLNNCPTIFEDKQPEPNELKGGQPDSDEEEYSEFEKTQSEKLQQLS